MTRHQDSAATSEKSVTLARDWARRAVIDMVRETGGHTVSRPVFRDRPDLDMTVTDAEAMAGMKAATRLTQATRALRLSYVRQAREDGHTWHEIGDALGLADRAEAEEPVAYAAFNYATQGHSEPSFSWTCPACHNTVIDYGPAAGPPIDAETHHADNCERLTATMATWNAEWEAEAE